MVREEAAGGGGRVTRRDLLRTIGAGGAVALAGCDGDGDGDTPTPTPDVTLLLATALSGEYGRVGTHQEQGFQLAIEHINEGGGLVDEIFDDLSGDGLLGREVSATTRDTVNTADTARDRAGRLLEGEEVGMVTGGVGGDVCLALSEVAAENGVPYMAGTAPNPAVTGEQCSPTTFRVQPHATAIAEALGDVLADEFPDETTFVRVTSQASEGAALSDAVSSYFSRTATPNWRARGNETVRPGADNLEDVVRNATTDRPDVIFLNLFGLDAINGLEAVRSVRGQDIDVVVPVIDDSLGRAVEGGMEGIYGTVPWDAGVGGDASAAFNRTFRGQYGRGAGGSARTGSGTAHVIYTQTLLFAAAAERAGSLETDAVTAELEGMTYDAGLGGEELRACDHQATRPVTIVRGTSGAVADGNRIEVSTVADDAIGDCDDSPAADCSF